MQGTLIISTIAYRYAHILYILINPLLECYSFSKIILQVGYTFNVLTKRQCHSVWAGEEGQREGPDSHE